MRRGNCDVRVLRYREKATHNQPTPPCTHRVIGHTGCTFSPIPTAQAEWVSAERPLRNENSLWIPASCRVGQGEKREHWQNKNDTAEHSVKRHRVSASRHLHSRLHRRLSACFRDNRSETSFAVTTSSIASPEDLNTVVFATGLAFVPAKISPTSA